VTEDALALEEVFLEHEGAAWIETPRRSCSGRGQHGLADRLRQLDRSEIVFRIEVVFAGFVDYAELPMLRRIGVGNDLIDLAGLQRNLETLVLQADDKFFSLMFA